jgi:hypothetical protein
MRTSSRARIFGAGLVGVSLAAGCGGDSSGNGVSTGLPPTQLLSDVTAEEGEQACERLEAGFQQQFNQTKIVSAVCTMASASQASTPASCTSMRDACLEEANQPGSETMMQLELEEIDFACGSAESMANLEGCGDTTVAQLETCFNDTLAQMNAMLNRFTCQDAGTVDSTDLEGFGEGAFEPAQSCNVIECGAGRPFG